jgi:SAM-dependent methyltransferase
LRLAFGVHPLSEIWAFDRGKPIHRYYINIFLQKFIGDIQGYCLEFEKDLYTSRYGRERVKKLDILHKEEGNPKSTIIADLTKPNQIPGNQFDCIICTHVLHSVFELDKFVQELYRILKPKGVLLIAVPHVSMCDPSYHEFWRFTPEGLQTVLSKVFGAENVTLQAYGNSLSTVADFRGLVVCELSQAELEYNDSRFALEVCGRAIKHL